MSGIEIVASNVLAGNPKHRYVRTSNSALKKRVFRHQGSHECLTAIGFTKMPDSKSDDNYVYVYHPWDSTTELMIQEEKSCITAMLELIKDAPMRFNVDEGGSSPEV